MFQITSSLLSRYKVLYRNKKLSGDPKDDCKFLLQEFDPTDKEWKIGNSKVFLKDQLEYTMERKRNAELVVAAMVIKKKIMGYLVRKRYLKIRNDIVRLQKLAKVRSN